MKKRKILSAVLAVAMIISMFSTASAVQPRASEHIDSYHAHIALIGGGDFEIHFEVYGTGTMLEIGVKRIIVQESSDGKSWSNAKTFYSSDYAEMMGEKADEQVNHIVYDGTSGMQYRAYITFYASNGSTSTTRWAYTSAVTAY